MSRRKVAKEAREEIAEEAEVVMRWSSKRIVVATLLVVVIIAGGLYAISLLSENPNSVLGQQTNQEQPKIQIPDEESVQEIIEKAQEDLANVNTKNIISSQPKIQQIINDLTSLTTSSTSAKDLICNAVCK